MDYGCCIISASQKNYICSVCMHFSDAVVCGSFRLYLGFFLTCALMNNSSRLKLGSCFPVADIMSACQRATLPIFNLISICPNNTFINVLCVSGTQLQNLLFFHEPVTSLVPGRTTNCLPLACPLALQAGQCCVCFERIFLLWQIKNLLLLKTTQYLIKEMFR